MPEPAPKNFNQLPSLVSLFGHALRRFRGDRGWTQEQLSEECERLSRTISRDQIERIERAAVKRLEFETVTVLAGSLRKNVRDFLPEITISAIDGESNGLWWDPTMHPDYSKEVLGLIRKHEEQSHELLGWAEFLPCSLETKAFMEAHHYALFRDLPAPRQDQSAVISAYNTIGNARRQVLQQKLDAGGDWKLGHLIYLADLERIAVSAGIKQQHFRRFCSSKASSAESVG
jgi:transcriptional regulator with XRE-family HTH domain